MVSVAGAPGPIMQLCPIADGEATGGLGGRQCSFVIRGGVSPGEEPEGLITGSSRICHHRVRVSRLACSDEVMGDVQQMCIQPVGVQTLQGLDDLEMDTLTPCRTWISVEDMPDQRVRELEKESVAQEYALVYAFLQEVQQLLFTLAAQRTEDLQGKAFAQERGELEDRAAAFTEPPGAEDEGAHHMLWELEVGWRGGGDQIPTAPLERVLLDQVVQDFLDEQRISARGCADRGGQLLGRAYQAQAADELTNL